MTPQEMNDEALRRAKEEQDKLTESLRRAREEQDELTEATLAGEDATDKAKAANLKMETATGMAVKQLQKLLDVQLRYTIAMAKGVKGSAAFNDSVDATADVMTTAVNAIGTALAFLLPGGVLVKGLVAGLTFLTTNAIKSAAALQKAANEQGDALDKAYKSMSKSGATASDGMTGLFKDVNRMRLNVMQLDAMAQTMANNAKEMTAMGGTVYKARKEYADLTENMKDFEKGMLMLGMSHEDQAEAIMGFMKMQSNLSQGQQKDYGQLKGAARKYIEETEALTRVTGMNRKEQEAAQEKYMAQQRFGAKVQQLMDEGKVDEANLLQSQMKKYAAKGEMFAQAFADMTTGMITSDAAMKGNMSTQGKMLEEANAITEGRIKTEADANQSFQETMTTVKDVHKSANALFQAGVGEDMFLPFKEGADITKAANQDFAKQVKEAETEVAKLTATVNKADAQLNRRVNMEIEQNNRMIATQKNLDNKFQDTAIGTGTFMEKLAKAFEPLMKAIGKMVAVFEPLVSGLGDMLIGTLSALMKFMTGDIMGGLTDFKAGWDSAAKGLEDTTKKYLDYQIEMITNFGTNLLKSVEFITGPLGPVFEKMGTVATDVWDSIKKSADEFGAGLLKGIALITSPLTDAFDKVKTGILGITDNLEESMGKFGNILVDMVNDIWKKLVNLIPSLAKAKEVAGEAVDTTKKYAQKGVDTVKDAGGAVGDTVKDVGGAVGDTVKDVGGAVGDFFRKTYKQGFGGGAPAPAAGGAPAPAAGGAPAPAAPAGGGKPAGGAPAPAGGAPAPAGGKPAAAPASSSGGGGRAPASAAPAGGGGGGAAAPAAPAVKPVVMAPAPKGFDGKASGSAEGKEAGAAAVNAAGALPFGAEQQGKEIRIGKEIRKGGSVAWRTNNPGNVSWSGIAKHYGAIGTYRDPNGDPQQRGVGIAIMPTEAAGDALKVGQWRRPMYNDLTIDLGVQQWAEGAKKEGRGSNYAKDLAKAAGATLDTVLGTLSDEQMTSMVRKQRAWESWRPGQVVQAAKGGVFDGPKSGYAATLHGNEAVIPLKDGAVPVSMSQEFNMTATNLGELVNQMKYNMAVQERMVAVLEEIRRSQVATADNTGRMVAYASN